MPEVDIIKHSSTDRKVRPEKFDDQSKITHRVGWRVSGFEPRVIE